MSDDAVREATGRGWDEWVALIEEWGGHGDGHGAIARWVEEQGVDGWWAQTVTVGFERITGIRLPHQMADGTFTAGVHAVSFDAGSLPSGVYFYRLVTPQGSFVRSLMLLK